MKNMFDQSVSMRRIIETSSRNQLEDMMKRSESGKSLNQIHSQSQGKLSIEPNQTFVSKAINFFASMANKDKKLPETEEPRFESPSRFIAEELKIDFKKLLKKEKEPFSFSLMQHFIKT